MLKNNERASETCEVRTGMVSEFHGHHNFSVHTYCACHIRYESKRKGE